MGVQFSKKSDNYPTPLPQSTSNSEVVTDLSSYEAAINSDPELHAFDSTLQDRTSRVISTLADGVEVRSLSLDALREVSESLLEMNQEVVKVILECKMDIWKSQELFSLVEEYFENSLQTLDFCTALQKCLKQARNGQLVLQVALQQYEDERREGTLDYLKTLQQFKNFKAASAPFSEEFISMFESIYKRQVSMLEKLQSRKEKLDKKLKSANTWRKVANMIFAATFATVLICSVVAAAVSAPPVVTALAAAAAVPLGSAGGWLNSIWTKYENEFKGQREIISSMQIGTYVVIKDLDSIQLLVHRLEIEMEGMLQNADLGIEEEEAVVLAMNEIKKKLSGFSKTIDDLSKHANKCDRDIRRARTVILRRIIKHPIDST